MGETYLGGRSAILIILIIIVASRCIFTPLFFLILKFLILKFLIIIQSISLTSSFNDKRLRLLLLLFNSFTLLSNPAFLISIF